MIRPQSIAITSGKGGVGKTYLSINLAVAIQRLQQRVLLFDSDLALANAHIFLGSQVERTILDALKQYCPDLYKSMEPIQNGFGTPYFENLLKNIFPTLEKQPIDKAVMEKSTHVRMLEVLFDWNDVGDWRAIETLEAKDAQGNVLQGHVEALGCKGSTIINEDGQLVAVLGLEDVVVVQSGGVTLVARKDKLDGLKGLVESLPAKGFGHTL